MIDLSRPLGRVFAVALAVGLVLVLLSVTQCRRAATAQVQARVAAGQASAAIRSGHDAVDTLGNAMVRERAGDQLTQENGNAIDQAAGADARVPDAVRIVGLQSLCRRASYRAAHAECMQQPAP